jgi:hypothetical protein
MKRIHPRKRTLPKKSRIVKRREKARRSAKRQEHKLRRLNQRRKEEKDARAFRIQEEKKQAMLRELERRNAPIYDMEPTTTTNVGDQIIWEEVPSTWSPHTITIVSPRYSPTGSASTSPW